MAAIAVDLYIWHNKTANDNKVIKKKNYDLKI